jgi:hypothetical protein
VDAEAVGELAHALNGLVAALADDVGRAELSRQRDPGGVAAEDDDLLGAEAPRGDHPAQADSAVTDDGDRLSGADLGDDRSVMARAHHVGEGEKRWHQRVVLGDRQDEQGPVRLGHPEGFGLCSDVSGAEEPSVDARRVQSFAAEGARAVGVGGRDDDDVAGFHGADVGTNGFDDADALVSHAAASLAGLHQVVRPEVAAAGLTGTSASVGSIKRASATFSMRTSRAPYMTVARIAIYLARSASSGSSIASDDDRSR